MAHVGPLPVEELVPVLAGTSSGLLVLRCWIMLRVRPGRRDSQK